MDNEKKKRQPVGTHSIRKEVQTDSLSSCPKRCLSNDKQSIRLCIAITRQVDREHVAFLHLL